jgi:hypothetical protein
MTEGFIERNKRELGEGLQGAKNAAGEFLSNEEKRLKLEIQRIKDTWLQKREDDIGYTREAFYNHYNLITIGGLGLMALVSAPVGLTPIFIAGAVAWEALWMGIAPSNERFRRSIRAQKNADLLDEQESRREKRLKDLPLDLRVRHEEAVGIAREIRLNAEEAEEGELDILDETIAKLDYLLEQYSDMLGSLHRTGQLLKDPEAETLEGRVLEIEAELENSPQGRVRHAKEKNLAVLRQRAQRFAQSKEEKEYFEVSLNTLENTLKLVRDRVIAATSATAINSSLDQVVLELSHHRDYMESVEAARSDLNDADEDLSAPVNAFEGTAADPEPEVAAPPAVERDISAPPAASSDPERPPGLLEEFSRE